MPRRTPVREIQKEEPVVSSPLRRSSRLSTSSPVPTKVITRRNSATETTTSTPKVTKTRRSSVNQELEPISDTQPDKKKTTSTIRSRRNSATSTENNDQKPEEITSRPRTRASSISKEKPGEVKTVARRQRSVSKDPETDGSASKEFPQTKELRVDLSRTTSRRRSVTEDAEPVDLESAKKSTRSSGSAAAKKPANDASDDTKASAKSEDVPASTPLKKIHSSESVEPLDSIEETNQEFDSPDQSPSKKFSRKNIEISKIDFDLSVINEASMTEEEMSPQKISKETSTEKTQSVEPEFTKETEKNLSSTQEATTTNDTSLPEKPLQEEQKSEGSVAKIGSKTAEEIESHMSDSCSFSLNLSLTTESDHDTNNKENVFPKKDTPNREFECEPMEVDDSVLEVTSPVKSRVIKSSSNTPVKMQIEEVGQKLQVAEKVTDEMAQCLSEEIHSKSPRTNKDVTQEVVVTVLTETKTDNVPAISTKPKINGLEAKQVDKPLTNGNDQEKFAMKDVEKAVQNGVWSPVKADLKMKSPDEEKVVKQVEQEQTAESETQNATEMKKIAKSEQPQKVKLNSKNSDFEMENENTVNVDKDEPKNKNTENVGKEETQDVFSTQNETKILEEPENLERISNTELSKEDPTKTTSVEPQMIPSRKSSVIELDKEENDDENNPVQLDFNDESVIIVDDCPSETDKTVSTTAATLKCDEDVSTVPEEDTNAKSVKKGDVLVQTPTEQISSEHMDSGNVKLEADEDESQHAKSYNTNLPQSINLAEANNTSSEEDDSYRSPVKKVRENVLDISDVMFATQNENRYKLKTSNIFERSTDPKHYCSTETLEKDDDRMSYTIDVIAISDDENGINNVEAEEHFNITKTAENTTNEPENAEKISEERESLEKERIANEEQNTSLVSNAEKKRSLDRKTITLQETMKVGETPEAGLSGRIHKYVDLFCAGIKNKSDVNINVSLEYVGQASDEDEDNKANTLEVSLTVSDCKERETESQKGSKRRRICPSSDSELESPKKKCNVNENQTKDYEDVESSPNVSKIIKKVETSPNVSISNKKEVTNSGKKNKKRRSSVYNTPTKETLDNEDLKTSSPTVSTIIKEVETSPNSPTFNKKETLNSGKKNKKRISSVYNTPTEKPTDNEDLETPNVPKIDKEEVNISPNVSTSSNKGELVNSGKKNKQRTSSGHNTPTKETSSVKTLQKVSFCGNSKQDSTENIAPQKDGVNKSNAAAIPLTPFKPVKTKTKVGSSNDNIEEESEEEESSDESQTLDSESSLTNLFTTSYDENDPADVTWKENSNLFSNSDSDTDDSTEVEIEDILLKKSPSVEKNEESQSESENDEVFIKSENANEKRHKIFRLSTYTVPLGMSGAEDVEEDTSKNKMQKQSKTSKSPEKSPVKKETKSENLSQETVSRTEKQKASPKSTNKRQVVIYSTSQSSESEENVQKLKRKLQKRPYVSKPSEKSSTTTNNEKQIFFRETKNAEDMLPGTSEVRSNVNDRKGRKRQLQNTAMSSDEDMGKENVGAPSYKKKKEQVKTPKESNKKERYYGLKPSSGNTRNMKPVQIKPSTGRIPGWEVTVMADR